MINKFQDFKSTAFTNNPRYTMASESIESVSSISLYDIKSYFYDFIDEFDPIKFDVQKDAANIYEVFVAIESNYWRRNRSRISESLHDCIIQLRKSFGFVKHDSSMNSFDRIDGVYCRVIKKSLGLKSS